MNIKSKSHQVQKQAVHQKTVNLTESQKKLWIEVPGISIPYGKFKSRLLSDIKKTEVWYYDYMWNNELLWEWNLMVLRENAMMLKPRKSTGFWSETYGAYLMGIREVTNE